MKTHINLFTLICLGIAVIFLSGMDGCDTEDPVAFIEASPEDGSIIQKYETIIVTFDGEPIDLNVTGADFSVAGSTVTIEGPFDPGEWNFVLTWTGGATVLTYTVEAPEAEDPSTEDIPVVEDPFVVPGMNLIVPGKSASGIKIGDTLEKVKQLYGEPNLKADHGDSISYVYRNIGLVVGTDDKNVVNLLLIRSSSRAKTASGIGIGSTRREIEIEFGKPDEDPFGRPDLFGWNYGKIGISFRFGAGNKVDEIFIRKPDA